jgi:hypothetical protein
MKMLFYTNLKFYFLLSVVYVLSQQTIFAQEKIATATVVDSELSQATKSKQTTLETKINVLLSDLRALLSDEAKKSWFQQNLESSIAEKSEQVCPSMNLIKLIYSVKQFVVTKEMDSKQLLNAVEFLNVSINELEEK